MKSRVRIRPPRIQDWSAFQAAVRRSHNLHGPWVHPPDTRKKFSAYLARMTSSSHRAFLVVLREGLSPRYLKIGGRWRDHERWALLTDAAPRVLAARRSPKR